MIAEEVLFCVTKMAIDRLRNTLVCPVHNRVEGVSLAEKRCLQIDMTYRVARVDGRIVELPIHFSDRVRGKSKMSSRIIVEAMAAVT